MKIVRLFLLLFVFSTAANSVVARGNSPAVKTDLDKKTGLVGEQITFTLSLEPSAFDSVSIGALNSKLAEKKLLYRSVVLGGEKAWSTVDIRVIFTSTKAGKITLNRLPVLVYNGVVADTLFTDPIQVEFKGDKVVAALQDIKPVISNETSTLRNQVVLYLSSIVVLLLACFTALKIYNRSNSKSLPAEATRYSALAEIEKLESLLMSSSVEGAYVQDQAFKTFKEYLEAILKLNLQSYTVGGLAAQLSLHAVGDQEASMILKTWGRLEEGRFAPVSGDVSWQVSSLQDVKQCIQRYPSSFQLVKVV